MRQKIFIRGLAIMAVFLLFVSLAARAEAMPICYDLGDGGCTHETEGMLPVTEPEPEPLAPKDMQSTLENCAWLPPQGGYLVRWSCLDEFLAFEAPDDGRVAYCRTIDEEGPFGPMGHLALVGFGPEGHEGQDGFYYCRPNKT